MSLAFLLKCHGMKTAAVSHLNEKESVGVASNYASQRKGKGGPAQRPVIQHSLDRRVKQ